VSGSESVSEFFNGQFSLKLFGIASGSMQFLTEKQVTITAIMISEFSIFFPFFGYNVNNLQSFILVGTGSKTCIATGTEAANLFSVKVDA
jgi:hypothetical protein